MTEINVALKYLTVSESNVRKTTADAQADAELKASLAAHGLLQNLVVHEEEGMAGHYAVDAGRRRVTLLKELAAEGVISEDLAVPCLLIEDASLAVEVSLIENTVRTGMHPADEVEAFAQLVRDGSTAAEIAVRFGMADRTVEQRLRLGNVSPVLLQAYRDGETSLEVLKAFAVTPDQKLQEDVWNSMRETMGFVNSNRVRTALLEDNLKGTSRVVQFVGVKAYEEAGGRVTRDLFAEEHDEGIYIEEPHIVYDLAERKLAALGEDLKDSWKWVECSLAFGYDEEAKFKRAYPHRGGLTDEEDAAEDILLERRHELLQDGISDESRDEYENIKQQLEEFRQLMASRTVYSEEQRAIAGCVVTIDYHGESKIVEGLVRPGDMPAGAGSSNDGPTDREKQAREKAGYSKKLMDEMRVERTKIVRSHLSGAFTSAFDLLLFQMGREVFGVERYFSRALDVEMFRDGSAYGALNSIDVEAVPTDWLKETDDAVAFEKMRSLTDEEKQTLFAVCVSASYKGQLTVDVRVSPEIEMVVDDLDIDFEAGFRPTADNFWGRLTKGRILIIAEETFGEEWADAHSGDKKAVLAKAMELAFAPGKKLPEGVSAEGRAAALAWTPAGFVEG